MTAQAPEAPTAPAEAPAPSAPAETPAAPATTPAPAETATAPATPAPTAEQEAQRKQVEAQIAIQAVIKDREDKAAAEIAAVCEKYGCELIVGHSVKVRFKQPQ